MFKVKNFIQVFFALALLLQPLSSVEAAAVEKLRAGVTGEKTRLVVNLAKEYKYKTSVEGKQLIINLPGKADKRERILVRDPLIRRAYLEPTEDGSRVVVVFAEAVPKHKVFLVKNPHRLVIDFPKESKPVVTSPAKPKPKTGTTNRFKVGEGLVYSKNVVNMGMGNVNTFVLELAPHSPYKLDFIPGYGRTIQKGILSKIAERSGAIAVVNASYFDSDIWVVGNLLINKKVLGMEETPRTGLVLGENNEVKIIPRLFYTGTIFAPDGRKAAITGVNRMRLTNDVIYYNDGYDSDTGTNKYGTEVRIRNGQVVEISTKGRMALNSATFVLSGNGTAANFLNTLRVGDRVEVNHDFGNDEANAAPSLGTAGPLLVSNGQMDVRSGAEQIPGDIAYGRAPRTAVGLKADGTVLLVVADGRSRYSAGMTLTELAQYFIRLNAVTAMNFDGGGSSEMLVRDRIMNNPSDGTERPVRVALGIFPR